MPIFFTAVLMLRTEWAMRRIHSHMQSDASARRVGEGRGHIKVDPNRDKLSGNTL